MVSKKAKQTLHRVDGKQDYLGGKLSFLQLVYLWFRSTTMIQGSFNYAYFQGTGYAHTVFPFFKKIYAGNKEKFKEAIIGNIEFFNTGPYFGLQAITSLHVLMLQTGSSEEQAKKIKFALMGPLAGINDSLFNFGSQPIIAGIAASLSSDGSWNGFWMWFLVYNIVQAVAGITLQVVTYRSGQKFMSNIATTMGSVVKISSMIGITVIAALALHYTGISLALSTTSTIVTNNEISTKTTAFQNDVLNKITPYLLQVILVGTIYTCMTKYSWSIYKALVFILLLGITGYVFGIF